MIPAEQDGQPGLEPVLGEHVPTPRHGFSGGEDHKAGTSCDDKIVNNGTGEPVAFPGHDGLQVDESNLCSSCTAADGQTGTAATAVDQTEKEVITSREPWHRLRSRKRLVLLIVIIMLTIVTAAVVGGILGSRKADGGSVSPSPSAPSPTGTPRLIKQKSSLSVTAWRKNQGMQILLYYQEVNGGLRYSMYDNTLSSSIYDGSYWGQSREIDMGSGDPAADDATLAAAIVLWGTLYVVSRSLRI